MVLIDELLPSNPVALFSGAGHTERRLRTRRVAGHLTEVMT